MAIAKVEPLTTARALRGPFDDRRPERMEGVGVGTVLRVPFGRRRVLGVVVEIAERSELPPERLAEPLEALEAGVPAELVRLGLWTAREYCSTPSRGLQLVLPPGTGSGGRRVGPRLERRVALTGAGRDALAGGARLGSRQRAVLEALTEANGGGDLPATELAVASEFAFATLRRLESRGLVELRQERELRGAEAALARDRGAIVLVPEIALTPQTLARFRERFGDVVALLHSALREGERYDEWERLRSGAARLCVGPRSAVFAPVSELGLIVIDEEHDTSYKQEGDPRYDARHVARRRAAEAGAVLIAGSATPRPESWLELPRLELSRRVDGRE